MMTRKIAGCIGIAAACWLTGSVGGAVIDSFSSVDVGRDGQPLWPVTVQRIGSVNIIEGGLTDVLGGVRNSTISLTSATVPGLDFIQTSIVPDMGLLLDSAASSGADGEMTLLYDGAGTLHADFSLELSIVLEFADFDFAFAQPFPVTITLGDGANFATLTQSLNEAGPATMTFNMADFSGINSVNLADITSVSVHLDSGTAADYRLTSITTVVIPTPGSLALLGLSGLVSMRRRRR